MKIGLTFFSVTLTALILINSTRASLTYAYYNIDPIGFIEALCENQDKPELQCNGKCHLKKVAQSQDKKESTPESIVDFKELILYPSPMTTFVLARNIYIKKEFFSSYFNFYSFNTSNDCFHPPRL
jgi:hypothetical protein